MTIIQILWAMMGAFWLGFLIGYDHEDVVPFFASLSALLVITTICIGLF